MLWLQPVDYPELGKSLIAFPALTLGVRGLPVPSREHTCLGISQFPESESKLESIHPCGSQVL